jgi:hypothetical protein
MAAASCTAIPQNESRKQLRDVARCATMKAEGIAGHDDYRGFQEDDMKIATFAAAACFALSTVALADEATPPAAVKKNNVCIQASFVDHTTVLSDTEILFYMKNQKIWKNTLRASCPGLKFENGFSQVIRGDSICSNMQIIRVLRRGNPCSLGEFTPYSKPPKS